MVATAANSGPERQMYPHGTPAEPGTIDVLVLDDSQFDAMCILRECRRTDLPVRVTIATNMEHFRELLQQKQYHLVFIDYMLPDGDGLSAQKILRGAGRNGQSPVVMISGEARHDVAVQAMRGGSIDYMAKSDLTRDALKGLILRALEEGSRLVRTDLAQALEAQRTEIITAMRDILREEMGMGTVSAANSPDVMRRMLQSYGLIPEDEGHDWSDLAEDPAMNFIFRTH